MKKRSIISFIAVFVSLMFLMGCGKSEEDVSTSISETEVVAEVEELMDIETSSGVVRYPAKWETSLEVTEMQEDGNNYIVFCANVEEKEYELFKLIVGKKDSDVIGNLTDSEGNKNDVYVEIMELGNMEELSTENQDMIYGMQEGINVIIENLR